MLLWSGCSMKQESVAPVAVLTAVPGAGPSWGKRTKIVFVDDGSRDETRLPTDEVAGGGPKPRGGSTSAVTSATEPAASAGLDHASGQAVIVMDGDLKDRARRSSLSFVERWRAGTDVVHAVRRRRKEGRNEAHGGSSAFDRTCTRSATWASLLNSGGPPPDPTAGPAPRIEGGGPVLARLCGACASSWVPTIWGWTAQRADM